MLLHFLERIARGLSPFRPVYSFAIALGLLGGGIAATLALSELLFASVLLALWGTLLEATCAYFGTGGGRRVSLVAQYGGIRQHVYPAVFAAAYLLLCALTFGLWRVIINTMDAGLA